MKKLFIILLLVLTGCFSNPKSVDEPILQKNSNFYIESYNNLNDDWRHITLTDLNSNIFTINDLHNKMTIVSIMAMWCSQGLRQQQELLRLAKEDHNIKIVSIDVDPSEAKENLLNYVNTYKFNWRFALDNDQKIRNRLFEKYGDIAINPKLTPIIIINKKGEEFLLDKGIKDHNTLVEEIKKYDTLY